MKVDRRAVALGVDHTDRLRDLGLPLTPYAKAAEEAIAKLSQEIRTDLARLGVLREEPLQHALRPNEIQYLPNWTLLRHTTGSKASQLEKSLRLSIATSHRSVPA